MPIYKAKSDVKQRMKQQERELLQVSDEAQNRLAEILADGFTVEKCAGTEWEIRSLRMGTEHLIVNEICKLNIENGAKYGDVLHELKNAMPTLWNVFTLILLNDKDKIYQNGDTSQGFSKLFYKTRKTIEWYANKEELSSILLTTLKLLDVSFFMDALAMLQIFRASVTEKKRTRTKIQGQK